MSQEKQEVTYECKCGVVLGVPYHASPNIAPSFEEFKNVSRALTELVSRHLNKSCPWVQNEKMKAHVGIKTKEFFATKEELIKNL